MATKSFRDLEVYRKSYELSVHIQKASTQFPKIEQYGITDQLRRSARSVCANIAEGYGRQLSSDNDFRRFLVIARGSCHEMAVWIDYCRDFEFIDNKTAENWLDEYEVISKMLYFLIKSLEKNLKRNAATL